MSEHERFLAFVTRDNYTEYINCAPRHLCSATRIDALREREPKAMQAAQGRGLVATADIHAGAVLAAAPVLASGIYAERLMRRAQSELFESVVDDAVAKKKSAASLARNHGSESVLPPELRAALMLMWRSMPSPTTILRVARDRCGVQDPYVAMQAQLALCLACERCNEESVYTSYFEALPHPAVDDARLAAVYKSFLDGDTDPYGGLCRDYGNMLQGLREEWVRNAQIIARQPDAGALFIAPMSIITWAWRIVLGHQMALPIYGKPQMTPKEAQLLQTKAHNTHQTHFTNWQMLHANEPEAELVPTLLPFFDLVDHAVSSNVRIDVVTREISVPALPHEYAEMMKDPALNAHGELSPESVNPFLRDKRERDEAAEGEILAIVRDAREQFEAQNKQGRKGMLSRALDSIANISSPFGRRGKKETAAYVQLQAMSDIRAGDELTIRYASDQSDHAFALYRFGFFPYSNQN